MTDETGEEFKRRMALELALTSFDSQESADTIRQRAEQFYDYLSNVAAEDQTVTLEVITAWATENGIHISLSNDQVLPIHWADINILRPEKTSSAIDAWVKSKTVEARVRGKRK